MFIYALVCFLVLLTNVRVSVSVSVSVTNGKRSILYAPFIPFIVLICNLLEVPTTTASTTSGNSSSSDTAKDLAHLTTFLNTIHPLTPSSTAIANLHRLCNVLYSIARLYVEARISKSAGHSHDSHSHDSHNHHSQSQSQGQGDHPKAQGQGLGQGLGIDLGQLTPTVGVEFDACFSALGLAPFIPASSDGGHGHGHGPAEGHSPEHGHGWNADQTTRLENWFSGNQYMTGLLEEDLSLIDCSGW